MGLKFRVYIGSTYFEFDSYEECAAYRTANGSPTDDIMSVTYVRPGITFTEPIQAIYNMNAKWEKDYSLTTAKVLSIATTLRDFYTYLSVGHIVKAEDYIFNLGTTADFTAGMKNEMIAAVYELKLAYGLVK